MIQPGKPPKPDEIVQDPAIQTEVDADSDAATAIELPREPGDLDAQPQ